MTPDTTLYWVVACGAALLAGLAKTGVPGLGILVVPILTMLFPAKQSVGALLPLLLIGDVAAVLLFRRHAQWPMMLKLAPWTVVGMLAGAWALFHLTDARLEPLLGWLILLLVGIELARRRFAWLNRPHTPALTATTGALTGFATMIGNVAGPVMNLFLIGKGFDKNAFMGTVAWFFLLINLSKVPVFVHLHMINTNTLRFDLFMAPCVIAGALIGRKVLHAMSDRVFHTLVLLLSAAAGLRLVL